MSDAKKRKRNEYSKDPAVWLQWFNEENSEEEQMGCDIDESDEDEENVTIESNHESDSQEASGSDVETSVQKDEGTAMYFLGKDKETKWRKTRPPKNTRTRLHNIVENMPGPRHQARKCKSEIETFDLFIDNTVLSVIVTSTNIFIDEISKNFARDRDARYTDITEIRALVGLLYLIGSFRCSRKNLHQLWDNSKGNGMESCYITMSEHRFRFLLRCVRFDNIRDRKHRRELDKFAAIRDVFEIVNNNFEKYFCPYEYITIDEQLLAFRGRCSFRQYIPSKPSKYGIKTFALVDAKTAYTMKLETYVGTQPDGPYKISNSPHDVVSRMVEPVEGTYRNITGDNWFSSIPLVKELLLNKKLTYVGTLKKNKREIPAEFLPQKDREENSSLFGFHENYTLVSYCPKKKKAVLVISSMHHDDALDVETGPQRKPEIITFYNHTKIGVDLVDQLCQKNNVARNTRRWAMVVFYNLLNVSAINAFCIYNANKSEQNLKMKRTDFIRNAAWEMIKPQIQRRSQISQIPREIRRRANLLLGKEAEESAPPKRQGSRGRCFYCGRTRDKTTRKWCTSCNRWACSDHLMEVCVTCREK